MITVLIYQALNPLKVDQFLVLLPAKEVGVLADELLNKILGALPLSFSPLVQNRLEESLIELSHGSEGGSAVEKVELLIILFSLVECLIAIFGHSVG